MLFSPWQVSPLLEAKRALAYFDWSCQYMCGSSRVQWSNQNHIFSRLKLQLVQPQQKRHTLWFNILRLFSWINTIVIINLLESNTFFSEFNIFLIWTVCGTKTWHLKTCLGIDINTCTHYSGVSLTQQSVILTMTLPVLHLPVSVREQCSLGSHQVQDLLSRK